MNAGIHLPHLLEHVIRPVLAHLETHAGGSGWSGQAAERLLIATVLAESAGGHYLCQIGGGPALGIYQMEPATHDDIWENWLVYKAEVAQAIGIGNPALTLTAASMTGNLFYATAMARVHYRRVPHALPPSNSPDTIGLYWKQHYNTHKGAGDPGKCADLLRQALSQYDF